MKSFTCPSCGAQIDFQSSITLYCVCAYCRSMVVRRDLDVEAIGKVAQLKEDSSPFQLGTQGLYRKLPFTLIGRVVRGWSDGQWNEWFMLLEDQRRGWLAEAQGQLMVFLESDVTVLQSSAKDWSVGTTVTFAKQLYSVSDIKESRCIGTEGELPALVRAGEQVTSIDLTAPPTLCATIELSGTDCPVYLGEFVEFEACRFNYLRELPGW